MTDQTTSPQPATILVVDDSPLNLNMVEQVLRRSGYTVHSAENGFAALEALEKIKPDLVVLDVMMPGMDGFEVCQRLRANERTAQIMVLMLTAHDTLVEKMRGFEAGADDYMTKPYEVPELRRRVAALLDRAQAAGAVLPATSDVTTRAAQIAVFSLRGGVGVTTLATNLGVSLAQLWMRPTLLTDMVLTAGQAALMLNLPLKVTWSFLAQSKDGLTADRFKGALLSHGSGLNLLASPAQATEGESLSIDLIKSALELARTQFDYLVVDCPHTLDAATRDVLTQSDMVLLLLTPDLASLRATASALDFFKANNVPRERLRLILNSIFPQSGLVRREIEATLGHTIDLVIPYTGEAMLQAVNTGRPITLDQVDLPTAALIEDLAYQLSKSEHQQNPPAVASAALGRVLQRLRKQRRERERGA